MDENNKENASNISPKPSRSENLINQTDNDALQQNLNIATDNPSNQLKYVQEKTSVSEQEVQTSAIPDAPQQQIDSGYSTPQAIVSRTNQPEKGRSVFRKILILGFLFILIVGVTLIGYVIFTRSDDNNITKQGVEYVDEEYGFGFSNTAGWTEINPQPGVYKAFATEKEGKVYSYVGISPIVKNENKGNADFYKNNCEEAISNVNGSFIKFNEITIEQLNGFRCDFEVAGTNLNKQLSSSIITLLGTSDGQYDYVINTSYPQGESGEMVKVENFVNSFNLN